MSGKGMEDVLKNRKTWREEALKSWRKGGETYLVEILLGRLKFGRKKATTDGGGGGGGGGLRETRAKNRNDS